MTQVLKRDEFIPIKGLEKNATTPVTGIENGTENSKGVKTRKYRKIINIPFISRRRITVLVQKPFYNHYIADVIISGDDIPALIPVNSPINLTVKSNERRTDDCCGIFSHDRLYGGKRSKNKVYINSLFNCHQKLY